MSWKPEATAEPRYEEWGVEDETIWRYVGTMPPDGRPVFFNRQTGTLYSGSIDHAAERLVPDESPTWEMAPGETFGEFLERVGQQTGWQGLSAFAREHLEDDGG